MAAALTRAPGPPEDPLASSWAAHLEGDRGAWIPDSSVSSCMICTKRFSFFRRRHHCRRCGACVCDACSTARVPLKLLPAGRARKKKHADEETSYSVDAPSPLASLANRGIDALADDTIVKYVRCCSKCASLIDDNLKSAIRNRNRGSDSPSGVNTFGSSSSSSSDEEAKHPDDAISV